VGLPLNMNGSRGPAAEAAEQFAERRRQRLGLPVDTWDERLSTAAANNAMIAADVSRARRKEVVDKLAAQIFLQNYLDAQATAAGPTVNANSDEDSHPEGQE
ncbi:MAG: Holliday junction resolvase RuvX, partial [Kiritimatiellaeota bacterium]|nr:Holliday junction resolvase RuvX [Kiritimatiellota bacterium]